MKKIALASLLLLGFAPLALAQNAKKQPPHQTGPAKDPAQLTLKLSQKPGVPRAENPFGVGKAKFQTMPALARPDANSVVKVTRGESGLPILFEGKTAESVPAEAEKRSIEARGLAYLASLQPEALTDPANEFRATRTETDAQGSTHVRLEQVFRGVPVFGGEVIAHARNGVFELLNGRYFPTPALASVEPGISAQQAFEKAVAHLGPAHVKTDWTARELALVGGKNWSAELIVFHPQENFEGEKLAWHLTVRPDVLHRHVLFVDAATGAILEEFDHTCEIAGRRELETGNWKSGKLEIEKLESGHDEFSIPQFPNFKSPTVLDGPVTASGTDLLNQTRSFGAWQKGSKFYMEDASKAMFNATASTMPEEPVGAIVTLDAFNTSPEVQSSFNYDLVQSNSLTFSSKAAVSAHWNSIKCYDYFRSTFNRNSIDGNGGNIFAFVNVAESNGAGMDNAFWNGDAMWYGNGQDFFKPLAGGLDVGGHEMTHGVVEKTANLVYQNESGALNESFADIFGAMIDRDDWKIGEDVVKTGITPGGALRSLQDPHNGDVTNGDWWQPKHINEKYNGSQDNGGVHINSGIVNHAFYLFATNAAVGKDRAEQVYYKALKDYLVKSSKFVDSRIAVLKAAQDLYGQSVVNAAAAAFDAVGITGSTPGGNYLGQLQPNPGDDYVLVVSEDYQNLDLADGAGNVLGTMYDEGLQSRPSISDNGSQVVFVNAAGHIITIDLTYTGGNINYNVNPPLSNQPEWRNAALSKDGTFIAALTDNYDNQIYVFDLLSPTGAGKAFQIYNPTYSQNGQTTDDARYADVLEFDYSGEYLMYDAYNEIKNSQGQDISYWDIGFLNFWENNQFTDGTGDISKLFNGLPEGASVGNPTFSKNSPFIIAFDYIDDINDRNDILGANIETGDVGTLVANNGDLGWPSYNRLDNALVYQGPAGNATNIYKRNVNSTKITGTGNETQFVADHLWAVWYADGNRSLVVDAAEPTSALQILAAPNPVSDVLRLTLPAKGNATAQIAVLNLLGQTLHLQNAPLTEGENQVAVPMFGLPTGTYLVRVSAGKSVAVVKVVKE